MSRLLKPIEYANELGISRQAVYAKIKKGLLNSKTINGKIYVVLDNELEIIDRVEINNDNIEDKSNPHLINVKELLTSKEETISVLKESISDLKHTNTEINTTLRGEIELLKQVFTEMRNLYVKQVDYMSIEKNIEFKGSNYVEKDSEELTENVEDVVKEEVCWITVDEFFERFNITKDKKKRKIIKRLKKAYKRDDRRVKKEDNMLFVSCYDFYEDILKKRI